MLGTKFDCRAALRRAAAPLACGIALWGSAGSAQMLAEDISDILRFEMLSGWREADGSHISALQMSLAPGWKTYWRSPGDGGVPTRFDFSGSQNLSQAQILWPHPKVFREAGLRAIGYAEDVLLPIRATPAEENGAINLSGRAAMAVCEEICIPVELRFAVELAPDADEADPAIERALTRQAKQSKMYGFGAVSCEIEQGGDGAPLIVNISAPDVTGRAPALVVESVQTGFWASEPRIEQVSGSIAAVIDSMHAGSDGTTFPDLSELTFSLITTELYLDLGGCAG